MNAQDSTLDLHKATARAWFESLRDDICLRLEKLEAYLPGGAPHGGEAPAQFARTPWERTDHAARKAAAAP